MTKEKRKAILVGTGKAEGDKNKETGFDYEVCSDPGLYLMPSPSPLSYALC